MENFGVNKRVIYFFIFILTAPLFGLFGWLFLETITDVRTAGEIYLSDKVKIECHGGILSIYRQKLEHNILALKTDNCVFDVPYLWENKFKVGDSISKMEGEFLVKHYREGKLIEILDYREVARNMK